MEKVWAFLSLDNLFNTGLLPRDRLHLYQREERALAQQVLELIGRALNSLGKGNTRLKDDEQRDPPI